MARNFVAASSQYLEKSGFVVTNEPFTFACWCLVSATNGLAQTLIYQGGSTVSGQGIWRTGILDTSVPFIQKQDNGGFTSQITNATTSVSTGVWNHICGVFSADNSRTIYLNGGNSATGTTNITTDPSTNPTTSIGRRANATPRYWNGNIAEAGIWSVALTSDDVAQLAAGYAPTLVRPEALELYMPLVRDIIDRIGGAVFTDNSTSVAVHPRVIWVA